MSAPGHSQAPIAEHAVRRVVQCARGRSNALIPERHARRAIQ
jgi:hypothetical protein